MTTHKVVKHDEWLKARRRHLAKEKEFTRLRDQLSRERRELPWELVEKHYTFEGEHGMQTLSDLFEGRGQLVIYHAMFNPATARAQTTWTADAPCFVCAFWMDNFNGITIHLNHRDITMAAISRAPYAKLAALGSPSRRVSRLMYGGGLLQAIGLVRQARPGGFCPACRVLMKAGGARQEQAKPIAAALVVLAVAGVAWAAMVRHRRPRLQVCASATNQT